jgi:CPA1 family monovalent cation:H+ antiporter
MEYYFPSFKESVVLRINSIKLSELILEGMLSFMLFAGANHIKFNDLNK